LQNRNNSMIVGEQRTAAAMAALADGWAAAHDIAWPRSPYANIDHVAIGPVLTVEQLHLVTLDLDASVRSACEHRPRPFGADRSWLGWSRYAPRSSARLAQRDVRSSALLDQPGRGVPSDRRRDD